MLVALAKRSGDALPDPVPHAMVITGIVVAVSATALALTLMLKLTAESGRAELPDRVLLVLLVISDLLLFELLAQAAGGVDFASLRQALASADDRGLMLGLLIAGFGVKTGVVGVHFWLAPAFVTAVRPALIGVMLGAGLLGWLRLLPLGEIQWTGAGGLLQWLAWVSLGYAVSVGLMQAYGRHALTVLA